MRNFLYGLIALLLALSFQQPALSQSAGPRIALVIGNSNYEATNALPNPTNDAKAVAQIFNQAGFEVVMAFDLSRDLMRQVFAEFAEKVKEKGPNSVALIYYAGHGLQVDGDNYLVPVDAKFEKEDDVAEQALRLADVMATMETAPSKIRIVILDACRNNPFSALNEVAGKGLAIVDAPAGTIVAYSTAPGTEAADGQGTHSPYAAAFMRTVKTPNLPIEQVFKKVRVLVDDTTGSKQMPWESTSLTSDFVFFTNINVEVPAPAAPKVQVAELRTRSVQQAYEVVVAEDSVEYYEEFVRIYPTHPLCDYIRRALSRRLQMIAWHNATKSNNAQAYSAFLSRHGNSDLAKAAQKLQEKPKEKPKVVSLPKPDIKVNTGIKTAPAIPTPPGATATPTPTTCPTGQTGTPPNCKPAAAASCPPGQTGTPPNCKPAAAATCPTGQTGTPPNCKPAAAASCPPGETGTPPNCKPAAAASCPTGQTGTPPNCKPAAAASCPTGQTGTPPNCKPAAAASCPPGETGTPPNCKPAAAASCPTGQTGTPPNCKPAAAASCPTGQTGTPPNCKPVGTTAPGGTAGDAAAQAKAAADAKARADAEAQAKAAADAKTRADAAAQAKAAADAKAKADAAVQAKAAADAKAKADAAAEAKAAADAKARADAAAQAKAAADAKARADAAAQAKAAADAKARADAAAQAKAAADAKARADAAAQAKAAADAKARADAAAQAKAAADARARADAAARAAQAKAAADAAAKAAAAKAAADAKARAEAAARAAAARRPVNCPPGRRPNAAGQCV